MMTEQQPKKSRSAKRVQLFAEAVAVVCPSCGETIPNSEGSEMWTAEDFRKLKSPRMDCTSCDAPLLIVTDAKVRFEV